MEKGNEDAVSPVIGVILMVAITVILAAVIAAFVFGMTGNVQSQKNVAVTAAINNSHYVVATVQGGSDINDVDKFIMNINTSSDGDKPFTGGVGQTFASSGPIVLGDAHVVITAVFKDGSQQVVLDRNF